MATTTTFLTTFTTIILAFFAPITVHCLSLDLHHRFSKPVLQWAHDHRNGELHWPQKDTAEYYAALVGRDKVLHRRFLADSNDKKELTLFGGNETYQFDNLGFLYYTFVELGTPNATVLVALDTGSYLLWVPCESTGQNTELGIYNPSLSTTRERVSCNSSFCEFENKCSNASQSCPFAVLYADNSSSLGVLVKDVLYLNEETSVPRVVKAPITFGCGIIQSGSFLNSPIPYGIFGLGTRNSSVPSILSSEGLSANSFSMCFGSDDTGRINFGDKGSLDQEETPFNINGDRPYYNITISGIQVGNSSIIIEFNALVDSGTSFTILSDPVYTKISESFNAQVSQKKRISEQPLGFENCYSLSANETSIFMNINLTTRSGGNFPVNSPFILIKDEHQKLYFCLAVLKSRNLNIIGQNFMRGLKIVFDRERMILGWKNFNCYDVEDSSTLQHNYSTARPPAAYAPSSFTPEVTQAAPNSTVLVIGSPSPSPRSSSHSMRIDLLNSVFSIFLLVLLGAI